MNFLYSICFFVAGLILVKPCQASDVWSMQYVYIQLKNGSRLHGYLRLNEQFIRKQAIQIKDRKLITFQDSLLAIYRMDDSLQLYTDLISDKTILDGIMLSKKKPVKVPLQELTSIRRTNGQYNGSFGGWGSINVVTEQEVELLAQKPYYFYVNEGEGVYFTLLSYHQAFKASTLQTICDQLKSLSDQDFEAAREKYRDKNIIILRFFQN